MNKRSECYRYATCAAPICPLQDNSKMIWYPDEEICLNRSVNQRKFVKTQRKFRKAARNTDRFFTWAMLNQGCIIRGGILGLDPDSDLSLKSRETRWLKSHPKRREMTDDEKRQVRIRFEKAPHKRFKKKKTLRKGVT